MAATDHGVDASVLAFRQLLARTATDDTARVEALANLSRRTVFVTAGLDGRLRALANRSGRTALPVFTALDTLGQAAARFGWFRPGGGLDTREIGAREALRAALERGVEFLVIDIGTPHQTEITRVEISATLASRRPTGSTQVSPERSSEVLREAVRQSERPQQLEPFNLAAPASPTAEQPTPEPQVPRPAPLPRGAQPAPAWPTAEEAGIDIDEPFSRGPRERAPATTATHAVSTRATATATHAAQARAPTEPAFVTPARPQPAPQPARKVTTAFERPRNTRQLARPLGSVAEELPTATRRDPRVDSPVDLPVASPAVDVPVDLPSIAPHPAREPEADPPEARHHVDESALDLPSIDLSAATPRGTARHVLASEPEAQPGALQAAALMRDIARKSGDADVEAAAAEVAAMLQQTALEGGIKKKDKGVSVMASQLARMLGGEDPSGGDEASEEQPSAAKLPDETLAAIAETLRKYPEVEWACDLSAARGQPSVGVRVDPSFLTRVDQISEATLTAAAPNEIDIEVLTDAAKMRKARSEGTVFFPWKGKR